MSCAARVPDGGRSVSFHNCTRMGVAAEEGAMWCRIHLPSVRKAKREAEEREWMRKKQVVEHSDAIAKARDAVVDRVLAHFNSERAETLPLDVYELARVLAKLTARKVGGT